MMKNRKRGLSPREREVLKCMAAGHSNKAIARRLNVAPGTIKIHVRRVFNKIGVNSRRQAAAW